MGSKQYLRVVMAVTILISFSWLSANCSERGLCGVRFSESEPRIDYPALPEPKIFLDASARYRGK